MTPAAIVKYEQDKLNNAKQKGIVPSEKQQQIKLKQLSFLAKKLDLANTDTCHDAHCYILIKLDDASFVLSPIRANILQDSKQPSTHDVMPSRTTSIQEGEDDEDIPRTGQGVARAEF